jgi:hypothetical protein
VKRSQTTNQTDSNCATGRTEKTSNQMKSLSIPIKVTIAVLGVALLLGMAGMLKEKKQRQPLSVGVDNSAPQTADAPPCTGISSRPSADDSTLSLSAHPHSVTLSWYPVFPKSTSPRDAIKGYYVYRSLTSQTYPENTRISEAPLRGTRCVDTNVEPRKTYFYVVKAVTEAGKQSGSSAEIQAVVPFP